MTKIDSLKRFAAVAVGLGTLTAVSNIITSKTTTTKSLPVQAVIIVGTFVLGAVVMDAAQNGTAAQIDELAEKVRDWNKK